MIAPSISRQPKLRTRTRPTDSTLPKAFRFQDSGFDMIISKTLHLANGVLKYTLVVIDGQQLFQCSILDWLRAFYCIPAVPRSQHVMVYTRSVSLGTSISECKYGLGSPLEMLCLTPAPAQSVKDCMFDANSCFNCFFRDVFRPANFVCCQFVPRLNGLRALFEHVTKIQSKFIRHVCFRWHQAAVEYNKMKFDCKDAGDVPRLGAGNLLERCSRNSESESRAMRHRPVRNIN